MDKIAGILLITLLAIVTAVSLSYYILNQPNQTSNTPSPTPTSSPILTPSPSETPTEPVSIPEPPVPEFTLAYLDKSYDVPPTTTSTTNPYSGETTITTNPGYRVTNKTVELAIENEPLTPYEINGETTKVYFNVRFKGHYSTEWITIYPDSDIGYPTLDLTSDYTKVIYASNSDFRTYIWAYIGSQAGEIDFQVQAMIGNAYIDLSKFGDPWIFRGETSNWSETQTISIP